MAQFRIMNESLWIYTMWLKELSLSLILYLVEGAKLGTGINGVKRVWCKNESFMERWFGHL